MEFLRFPERNNFEKTTNTNNSRRRKSAGNNNSSSMISDFSTPMKQRSQANARERDRTHSVNTAFSTLRTLIPTEPKDRKLSKIETLRLASSYISHLGTQLMAGPIDQPCFRISKTVMEEDPTNRHQVCTFCISHRKSPKNLVYEEEYVDCRNYENQATVYLDSSSSSSASSQNIVVPTDLTIYYQH